MTHDPADYPPGATFEPWSDDDDREAEREAYAALTRRQTWTAARYGAARWRAGAIAFRTCYADDRGAFALLVMRRDAALAGLVPDPERLDADAFDDRRRELLDVWQHIATARADDAYAPSGARYYEDSDGFEERSRLFPIARHAAD